MTRAKLDVRSYRKLNQVNSVMTDIAKIIHRIEPYRRRDGCLLTSVFRTTAECAFINIIIIERSEEEEWQRKKSINE